MTANDIIRFAIENNIRFEYYTSFETINDECVLSPRTHIGIELKQHVWFWFTIDADLVTNGATRVSNYVLNEGEVFFRQRYNQVNGYVMKSVRQEMKAEKTIMTWIENNPVVEETCSCEKPMVTFEEWNTCSVCGKSTENNFSKENLNDETLDIYIDLAKSRKLYYNVHSKYDLADIESANLKLYKAIKDERLHNKKRKCKENVPDS